MERSIIKELRVWKDDENRKPLILTGVRQCGKTFIMREFAEAEFSDFLYVNLEKNELAASVFDYDYDVKRILRELCAVLGKSTIEPGKSLLILDEIQAAPRAVTAMKYFCEDMRELHIICAGSLLGVALKRQEVSFPVGKVNRLQMYPMSFREFLLAECGEEFLAMLEAFTPMRPLPEALEAKLIKHYRDFLFVGGMPEVVDAWTKTHDYAKVAKIQETIIADYAADFSKHAPLADVPKLRWIWESVPKQLAKDNNKFVFSQVKAGKRAHELENALQWLVDAGLVYRTELVENPTSPLSFAANASVFKVYLADVGLLCRMAGLGTQMLFDEAQSFGAFRGALAENYVHNELLNENFQPYFWRSGNTAEVDFLVEREGRAVPIEVKSADNTRAKSYRLFCKRYEPKQGFKVSLKNIAANTEDECETISLPLYLLWRIRDFMTR